MDWDPYWDFHTHPYGGRHLYGFDVRLFMDLVDAELRRLGPNTKVLDDACGADKFSIVLASRGYHVTGFDLSDKGVRVDPELGPVRPHSGGSLHGRTHFRSSGQRFLLNKLLQVSLWYCFHLRGALEPVAVPDTGQAPRTDPNVRDWRLYEGRT